MFGKFTVEVNGEYIYHGTERVSNMIRILQYLLLFHGSIISQSELIAECLGEETENEAVVLKNLIYRLRKIFLDHVGEELIIFKNGGYGMDNARCEISLDVEEFVAATKRIQEERNDEERLQ
jgi:DNA-binding winged helix-turn-helix (wHTH) protein